MAPYNGSHPAMGALGKFFLDNGLFTFVRWGSFMCNPPLCITEEQLREAATIKGALRQHHSGLFDNRRRYAQVSGHGQRVAATRDAQYQVIGRRQGYRIEVKGGISQPGCGVSECLQVSVMRGGHR